MESAITLWQFLLQLLLDQSHKHLICWTSNDGEFKLLKSEEVARLWGLRKNKTNMNYDKLSRALRYYYDKNIIRKVIGQKFVYKFVSFPDILKLDPHAVEAGQHYNKTLDIKTEPQEMLEVQVKEEKDMEEEEQEEEEVSEEFVDEEVVCQDSAVAVALQVQACYREYLRSGLYASLPFGGALQRPTQLLRGVQSRRGDTRDEDTPSVIHFVAPSNRDSSGGCVTSTRSQSSSEPPTPSYRPSKTSPHTSSSSSPPILSPAPSHPWRSPKREVEDCEQDVQPLNLSSGRRQSPLASDRRSGEATASSSASSSSPLASRSRKPKGLVISNPSVVLAGCDLGSIALNSPALPSGSLTPGLLSAQQTASGLLLSPSPLLSSLQLWNSLSPVGPLSPGQLQGHAPLFQFPTLLNGYVTVPVSSLDGSSSPMLLSSTNQKS